MTLIRDPEGNVHDVNFLRAMSLVNSQRWQRLTPEEVREINRRKAAAGTTQSTVAVGSLPSDEFQQQMLYNAAIYSTTEDSKTESSGNDDSCHSSHKHSNDHSYSNGHDSSSSSHGHSSDYGYSSGHDSSSSSHDYGGSYDSGSSGGDF